LIQLKLSNNAYLNYVPLACRNSGVSYVFFDNQFKFVDDGSGVKQVDGEPGNWKR
jgi:hypothetical protein